MCRNLTIYHCFLSCQPLAALQNMLPTGTSNSLHNHHECLISQAGALKVLVYENFKQNLS